MPTARTAVFTMFLLNGVVLGSWVARVPALAAQIGADPGHLGVALLGASVGLVLSASAAARVCAARGPRTVMVACAALVLALLPVLGSVTAVWQLAAVLFLFGVLIGGVDVGMNITAVSVLRRLNRPLMPVFHAGFSVGGLVGSAGAALAAGAGWSPRLHFLVAALVGIAVLASVARALPNEIGPQEKTAPRGPAPARRPALWALAGVALCSAIAEGATADWSALFLTRERGVAQAAAAIVYSVYSVCMAVSRLLGEHAQRRLGPHRLLAGGALLAALGLFGAVAVPVSGVGYVGFALAGVGLAFCFPVVMDLTGAVGRRPDGSGGERELGFVTTVAYTGFLAGPPLVGGLAQVSSLVVALAVVGCVVAAIAPVVWLARRARQRELAAEVTAPAGVC